MAIPVIFDSQLLRQRLQRRAATFAQHDFLHKAALSRLMERVDDLNRHFTSVVTLGDYLGYGKMLLQQSSKMSSVLALHDVMHADIDVISHGEALPLLPASLDAVFSCNHLHLLNDIPGYLWQVRHSLRPDGLLSGVMLGGETLSTLRQVLQTVDIEIYGGMAARVHPMVDAYSMAGLLQRAGFALPVVDSEKVSITYPSVQALLHDWRGMGLNNTLIGKRPALTRRYMAMAEEIYQQQAHTSDGQLTVIVELIFFAGWTPAAGQQKPLPRGSGKIALGDALQ